MIVWFGLVCLFVCLLSGEAEHREEVHRIGQQQAEGFTRLEALIRVMAQDLHNIKNQNEEILRENAYLKFLIEGRAAIPPSPTEADISEDFVFPIQEHEELARLEKYLDEDGIGRNKLVSCVENISVLSSLLKYLIVITGNLFDEIWWQERARIRAPMPKSFDKRQRFETLLLERQKSQWQKRLFPIEFQ